MPLEFDLHKWALDHTHYFNLETESLQNKFRYSFTYLFLDLNLAYLPIRAQNYKIEINLPHYNSKSKIGTPDLPHHYGHYHLLFDIKSNNTIRNKLWHCL